MALGLMLLRFVWLEAISDVFTLVILGMSMSVMASAMSVGVASSSTWIFAVKRAVVILHPFFVAMLGTINLGHA